MFLWQLGRRCACRPVQASYCYCTVNCMIKVSILLAVYRRYFHVVVNCGSDSHKNTLSQSIPDEEKCHELSQTSDDEAFLLKKRLEECERVICYQHELLQVIFPHKHAHFVVFNPGIFFREHAMYRNCLKTVGRWITSE